MDSSKINNEWIYLVFKTKDEADEKMKLLDNHFKDGCKYILPEKNTDKCGVKWVISSESDTIIKLKPCCTEEFNAVLKVIPKLM